MDSSKNWSKNDLIEIITSTSLFKELNRPQIEDLLNLSNISSYVKGEILFHQGDVVENVYLILDGSMKILRTSEYGNEVILQLLHFGNTFMETSVFLESFSPVSAQIVKDTTLLAIPFSFVRHLLCINSQFSQGLIKVISEKNKETFLKLESILLKSPVQRIGYYLLGLLVELGSSQRTIKLPDPKSLIAGYLGMKPETFSRAMAEIKKLGVNVKGDEVTLLTISSLCRFCDIDTTLKCQKARSPECHLKA